MPFPYVSLRYHFVWTTWDRAPLITAAVEAVVHASIRAKCIELGAMPFALGGIDDHVHLLVGAPASLSPSALIGPIKGASSHRVNLMPTLSVPFRWQGGYGVFSVSRGDTDRVVAYIREQRHHHQAGSIDSDLERVFDTPVVTPREPS